MAKAEITRDEWNEVVKATPGHIFEDRFDGPCRFMILRGPVSLCAYLGVPKGHPLWGMHHTHLHLQCHGGLNYSGEGGECLPNGFWWYRWDYAHAGDFAIFDGPTHLSSGAKKWTVEEVKEDTWATIDQFKKLANLAVKVKEG